MNTEQERAEFEARVKAEQGLDLTRLPHGGYRSFATHQAWWAWQARAALQSQVKNDTTLFCDLKTDEEKSTFFLTGRGYETGVIAHSIQNDVAMAYHRCSEYRKEVEALQAENERLRTCLAETAGVAVTMLYESHRQDTLKEFDVTELARMVDYTKHLADANVQVEKVYRKAWNMAQGCAGAD